MDDKWFKRQQKIAGVTAENIADRMGRTRSNVSNILTGKQKMSLEWAQAFADTLQVPLSTVLEKAGVAGPQTAQELQLGFAEADAVPFVARERTDDPARMIARALGADRPGVDVWTVKSDAMVLGGVLPGDHFLLDTHASERCGPGDLVVAQIYKRNEAITVLRRFQPPVLVAAAASPESQGIHVVDGINVVIRGRVIAVWRI